ncbi:MAG: methionyl-tRNA formyltransferase [Solitalea-like symbiont of Acarus siro]
MKIVFFGSTIFSTHILDAIMQNTNFKVPLVITIPDKISGRGLKKNFSPVKTYSLDKGLNILQPVDLKDSSFLLELSGIGADAFVVVAFRFLPKIVWEIAPSFNVDASLLPQSRGAAPIERCLMNGDKETGVTTFFLQNKIDTGDILLQKKILIEHSDNNETLRRKLANEGARVVIDTLKMLDSGNIVTIKQDTIIGSNPNYFSKLHYAHKLDKSDFCINWDNPTISIHNQIRALSPGWGAYTILNNNIKLKIFEAGYTIEQHNALPGTIVIESKKKLIIATKDGFIEPIVVQVEGKKPMPISAFLNGYKNKIMPEHKPE